MKTQPVPETITSDAQAEVCRARIADLTQEGVTWHAERERVSLARGEAMATGTTASLAEAGRLSAKISMGDVDDTDRRQVITVLRRRLARWEDAAAARQAEAVRAELADILAEARTLEARYTELIVEAVEIARRLMALSTRYGALWAPAYRAGVRWERAMGPKWPGALMLTLDELLNTPRAFMARWRGEKVERKPKGAPILPPRVYAAQRSDDGVRYINNPTTPSLSGNPTFPAA